MKRRLLGAVTAVPVALAMAGTGSADAAVTQTDPSFTDGVYIVQMADLPVVAYDGTIAGYQATKPAKGAKVNPQSAAVTKYVDRLKSTKRGYAILWDLPIHLPDGRVTYGAFTSYYSLEAALVDWYTMPRDGERRVGRAPRGFEAARRKAREER